MATPFLRLAFRRLALVIRQGKACLDVAVRECANDYLHKDAQPFFGRLGIWGERPFTTTFAIGDAVGKRVADAF